MDVYSNEKNFSIVIIICIILFINWFVFALYQSSTRITTTEETRTSQTGTIDNVNKDETGSTGTILKTESL
jgi:hypothetical protein